MLWIIPLTLVSLEPLVLSDDIHARSFASLIHRLVRLQLTSPLAYNIAQLFEPRLFQLASPELVYFYIVIPTMSTKHNMHETEKYHYQLCRHNTRD